MKKRIFLPKDVKFIIESIENAGFEAYAVGGCVRDTLLGRTPDDWDITTSAKPNEVKEIFRRTVDTGIQHGTVTVMLKEKSYEVTTYRIDGEYEDSRHPKKVEFTPNLKEDLARRDFTINAMAYNERDGIVDEFGGMEDLAKGIVRAVGYAESRFEEDALRIFRAFRFAAVLNFDIAEDTLAAAAKLAPTLERISAERINIELTKLLMSDNPDYILKLYENGITSIILPEFDLCMKTVQNNPHHCYNVGEHIARSMKAVDARDFENKDDLRILRFALLMHDLGKPETRTTDEKGVDHFSGHELLGEEIAGKVLRRLKSDNNTIDKIKRLVRWHDSRPEADEKSVRRSLNRVGEDIYPLLLKLHRADIAAQSDYKRTEKIEIENRIEQIYHDIINRGDCISLKMLSVNGGDLIAAGMKPGKELGEVLKGLLELVLEDPSCNEKEILLRKVKELQG